MRWWQVGGEEIKNVRKDKVRDFMGRFSELLNKRVKALYLDNGETRVVKGFLEEANDAYIVVNGVVIGLGSNFISCIPQEGNNDRNNNYWKR